jgi:hypothetical protein
MGMNENIPLSYTGFKNRASIHKYNNKYKIVFVGLPKKNLFGFYTMYGNDSKVMKEAYEMYFKLVKGDMRDYNDGDIQWGNCGIPLGYGGLRIQNFQNELNF